MKLEINTQIKYRNCTSIWKFKTILFNNQWITEESKMFLQSMYNGYIIIWKLMGCHKSSSKKEVYSSECTQ